MKVSRRGRTVSIRFNSSAQDQTAARQLMEQQRQLLGYSQNAQKSESEQPPEQPPEAQ
jgi:cell division protein FtsN